MHSAVLEYAAALIFGYLCGSIPFGILLTRLAGAPDLRSVGSGNIGATNVLRTGRKGSPRATLARRHAQGHRRGRDDRLFFGRDAAIFAALGAFLGHLFPVWLELQRRQRRRDLYRPLARPRFVAGARGVLRHLGRDRGRPATRRSPRLTASAATPVILWWNGNVPEAELFLLLSVLLWLMHRANIARLVRGTESRIGGA